MIARRSNPTSAARRAIHLVSLGEVRSMEAARKGARQELFVCARCDTEWEYTHDKRDETAGWRRVQPAREHTRG